MKRLRPIRSLAMVPAAVWLLIQLSMTGLIAMPTAADAGTGPDVLGWKALGLHQVEICSPDGTATFGPNQSESGGHAGASHCEWCQTFGSISAPPHPETTAMAVFESATLKYRLASVHALVDSRVRTGFSSRAPPL